MAVVVVDGAIFLGKKDRGVSRATTTDYRFGDRVKIKRP